MIELYIKEIENSKLSSEDFARKVLSKNLYVPSNSLIIRKNEFGKPYLSDYPRVNYNISHTKGVIVCALANKPVGVDIEKIKPFDTSIVKRFFSQNEQEYIFAKNKNQNVRFTEIWTMKEAFVKFIGKGMEIPLDSFDVLNQNNIYSIRINNHYISICSNEIRNKINDSNIIKLIYVQS